MFTSQNQLKKRKEYKKNNKFVKKIKVAAHIQNKHTKQINNTL